MTLALLERNFKKNEKITPGVLVTRHMIAPVKGRAPNVKIVARGSITTPLTIQKCLLSADARKKVEAAGGTVQ